MSAKLIYIVSIGWNVPKIVKTLQPCSEESMYNWKGLYIKQLNNVTLKVQCKISDCNEDEPACRTGRHTGSSLSLSAESDDILKIETWIDEHEFDRQSRNSIPKIEKTSSTVYEGGKGNRLMRGFCTLILLNSTIWHFRKKLFC